MRSVLPAAAGSVWLWQGLPTQPLLRPTGLQNSEDGAMVPGGWTYRLDGGAITLIMADNGSK